MFGNGILRPYRLVLSFVILCFFSSVSYANCDGTQVVADLQRYGIAAELDTDGDDWDIIKIFRNGDGTTVFVESDGDMIFREWYGKSYAPSLEKANRMNNKFKYVTTNIDDDGDFEVSYYVRNFEDGCSSYARNHAMTWWDLEDLVEEFLEDSV